MNSNDFPKTVQFRGAVSFPHVVLPQVQIKKPLLTFNTAFGNTITKSMPKYKQMAENNKLHVRDLGDLLFGNPVTGTRQLENTLRDNGLDNLVYVPLLNRIAGAGLMLKERAIEPIANGEPLKAGVNALETLGYTADTLSNIVKSFLPVAGGGTWNDFLDSLGWRAGRDRRQYQADTGNFITDILVEILADPTTWLSATGKLMQLGNEDELLDITRTTLSKALYKNYMRQKGMTAQLAQDLVENEMKHINDDTVRLLYKTVSNSLSIKNSKILEQLKDMLSSNTSYYIKDVLTKVPKDSPNYEVIKKLILSNELMLSKLDNTNVQRRIMDIRFSEPFKWYRRGDKLLAANKQIDNFLLVSGLQLGTGVPGLLYLNTKMGLTKDIAALWNNTMTKLKEVKIEDVLNNKEVVIKRMNKYISDLYDVYYKPYWNIRDIDQELLDRAYKNAVNLYTKLLSDIKPINASIDWLDTTFLKRFLENNPAIRNVNDTDLNAFLQPAKREAMLKFHTKAYIDGLAKAAKDQRFQRTINKDLINDIVESLNNVYISSIGKGDGTDLIYALRNFDSLTDKQQEKLQQLLAAFGLDNYKNKNEIADLLLTAMNGENDKIASKISKLYIKKVYGDNVDKISVPRVLYNINKETSKDVLTKDMETLYKELKEIKDTGLESIITKNRDKLQPVLSDIADEINEVIKSIKSKQEDLLSTLDIDLSSINDVDWDTGKGLIKLDANPFIHNMNMLQETIFRNQSTTFLEDLKSFIDITESDLSKLNLSKGTDLSLYNRLQDDIQNLTQKLDLVVNRYEKLNGNAKYLSDKITLDAIDADTYEKAKYLSNLLKNENTRELMTNVMDLTGATEKLYALMLTSRGNLNYLFNSIADSDLFELFFDTSKEGVERYTRFYNSLVTTVQHLNSYGLGQTSHLARELSSIMLDIENTKNIAILYSTDLNAGLPVKLNKDVTDYILGEINNVLTSTKYRNVPASQMFNQLDEVTDYILAQTMHFNERSIFNTVRNNVEAFATLNPEHTGLDLESFVQAQSDLINFRHAPDEFKDLVQSSKDWYINEEEAYATFLDSMGQETRIFNKASDFFKTYIERELRSNIYNALEKYTNNLVSMDGVFNTSSVWFKRIDEHTVLTMRQLGLDATTIDAIMSGERIFTNAAVTELANLVVYSGDRVVDFNPNGSAADILRNIGGQADNLKVVTNAAVERANNALANTITDAYIEIDKINAELAGFTKANKSFYKGTKYYSLDKSTVVQTKNYLGYISADDFNNWLRANTTAVNGYEWATRNHFIGLKSLNEYSLAELESLSMKDLNFSMSDSTTTQQLEFLTFASKYNDTTRFITRTKYSLPNNIINMYRTALIEVYSHNDILFGPKDPITFFSSLDDVEIIKWHFITSDVKMNKTNANLYNEAVNALKTEVSKITPREDMLFQERSTKLYNELTLLLDRDVPWTETELDNIIKTAPSNTGAWITDAMERKLTSYMKDPESLAQHQAEFNKYIQENTKANKRLLDIYEIANDNRRINELLGIESTDLETIKETQPELYNAMNRYKLRLDDWVGSAKVQRFLKRERAEAFAYNIRRMSAKQLRTYIDNNTQGFMIFYSQVEGRTFKFRKKDLENAGLVIESIPDLIGGWFIRRTSNVAAPVADYKWIIPDWIIPELQDTYTKFYNDVQPYFFWDTMKIPNELYTGEMMELSHYDALMKNQHISRLLGDYEVQKTYLNLDENGLNNFFTKDISRPNGVIVGDPSAYNVLLDYIKRTRVPWDEVPNFYYKPMTMDKSTIIGTTQAILRQDAEQKYLQLFFNDDYSITGKFWNKTLSTATDTELGSLFARNKNVAVILRENKRGLPQVYKVAITGRTSLDTAAKAGAIVIPYETYRSMVLTINKHRVSGRFMQLYNRFVTQTFKSLYLTSPGFLFRNGLDSLVYKNMATSDGIYSLLDNFKYEHKATKLLELHDEITRKALEITQGATLNKKVINSVLEHYTPQEQAQYRLVEIFLNSHASGGYTKALREYLLEYNMQDMVFDGSKFEEWWINNIVNNKLSTVVQDVNSQIEQTARLGLFLNLVDNGGEVTDAIAKVVETHFDYDLFANRFKLLEEIFWFSTFPINNIAYYLNYGITKNPELLKLQLDLMEQSWNSNDVTWEDVKESRQLTYHALTGNLRLYDLGEGRLVLKTGSSVYDFFKTMFLPVESAKEHLNPLLSVMLDLVRTGEFNTDELDPTSTIRNRAQKVLQGENYLPSIFGTLYGKRTYPKYNFNRLNRTKTSWTYSKRTTKIRRPSSRAQHFYKLSSSRYYFGKNLSRYKSAKPKYATITPYFFKNRSQQARRQLYRLRHKKSELYR